MKRKRILWIALIIVITIILSQVFSKPKKESTEEEKQNFTIKTMTIGWEWWNTTITKNARIEWISEITLSAQVWWRVRSLNATIWENVSIWTNIAQLTDTQWSLIFRAESSQLSIDSAENSYEVQKRNLEKQISDLLIARERAQLSYDNTIWNTINNTTLQIESLEKSLEKARLDYNTKVNSDWITLQNNIQSAKNIYSDTLNLLVDIIDQSDRLLWVTEANEKRPEDYDIYLWWRDVTVRSKAESELLSLFGERSKLQALWNNITSENITGYLEQYKVVAQKINDFTVTMKDVFINSIIDERYLPKAKLDWHIASFWVLQAKASWIVASITNQSNAVKQFIESYWPNQESLASQIEILENDIAIKKAQLEEAAKNAELNLDVSDGNYNFAVNTKELNLETIENNLRSAQIALQEAQFNFAKLSINAPIAWVISDILVDVWQEVSPWTPIAKMVSKWIWMKLSMSEKEIDWIVVWQEVSVVYEDTIGTWRVVAVWSVGDKNGNIPVEIYITDGEFTIWTYASVSIPTNRSSSMIPLNAVSIVDNNVGQIVVRDGNEISTKRVRLWLVLWNYIEIVDWIEKTYQVVLTDTKNYDKETMNLIIE